MKGLGMGRLQQRFNAAVATVLTLAGYGGLAGQAKDAKQGASKGHGHPAHRTLLKSKLDGCPAGFHCTHRASCSHYQVP
jgi:hypothetical protein